MAGVAVTRRRFDAQHDARLYVCLTDGVSLYEIVAVRGIGGGGSRPRDDAAIKLLDVNANLPRTVLEEIELSAWIPVAEASEMEVVALSG